MKKVAKGQLVSHVTLLRAALHEQFAHYFSDEAWKKDGFLKNNMGAEGWINLKVFTTLEGFFREEQHNIVSSERF